MNSVKTHIIGLLFGILWTNNLNVKDVTATRFRAMNPADNILQFWEPDPRFGGRRKNVIRNTTFQPIKNERKSRSHHGSSLNKSPVEEKNKFRSKPDALKNSMKSTTKKTNDFNLRMGYLKPKAVKFQENESTRIAPYQLMQQDMTSTNKPNDSSTLPFVLTTYACREQYDALLAEVTNAKIDSEVLGRTASYNDILLYKISLNGSEFFRAQDSKYVENEPKQKKIIFIVHALNTMGIANLYSLTVESYLKELLYYYFAHLDKFDIYLIPLANPDGYIQSRKFDYWTKNMSPNADCPGVDVDRNFDVAWNSSSVMSSCSPHYPGTEPFSEPESKAIRDVLHRMGHKIHAYIHVHAGTYNYKIFKGDAVLYPKGYTERQSDDDKYVDLKGEIDEAIKNANFKVLSVTVDTLHNWYGPVLGTSVDYAATVYGIPFAMEMVMQIYQDPGTLVYKKMMSNDNEEMEYFALTEIWRRVIDVTFKFIYKNQEANGEAAKQK